MIYYKDLFEIIRKHYKHRGLTKGKYENYYTCKCDKKKGFCVLKNCPFVNDKELRAVVAGYIKMVNEDCLKIAIDRGMCEK